MSERMRDEELAAALVEIGARLDYPEPTRLAVAVRARLREPRRRGSLRTVPAFAPAFVTLAVLLLIVALASPGVRSAAREFLHLRGIDIFPVPSAPAAPSVPGVASTPTLAVTGERTTLEGARGRVRFTLRVPTAPALGTPDDVFVDTVGTTDRVSLVYRERSGIPVSKEAGISALVVEFRGAVDETFLGKAVGPGTTFENVTVNGGHGVWLEGAPHFFFYRDPSGNILQDTLRLAGNTLIWEQDGVTIRLEAALTMDEALRIASTFR